MTDHKPEQLQGLPLLTVTLVTLKGRIAPIQENAGFGAVVVCGVAQADEMASKVTG